MSSGPIPGYADAIPQSMVEELCPVEFKALLDAAIRDTHLLESLGDDEETLTYLEYAVSYELMWEMDDYQLDPETHEAWEALRAAFEKATETEGKGLTLHVSYYDGEMGGPYDDVESPIIWSVGQMYVLSPAGERFKDSITRQFYTQYG